MMRASRARHLLNLALRQYSMQLLRQAALRLPALLAGLLLSLATGLLQAQDATAFVDVSIRVFESTVAAGDTAASSADAAVADAGDSSLTPDAVRLAEVRYMPMHLRYHLEASGRFGAVRVLPLLDNGAELMIEGRILFSDQFRLELALRARDSSGRLWLDKTYAGSAVSSSSLNENAQLDDDFAELYRSMVRDLIAVLDSLTADELREIETVALLRYGAGLAPQHFAAYLAEEAAPDDTATAAGGFDAAADNRRYRALRLPAVDDPLLLRVQAIREREFLFIDVVDEEYSRFHAEIKPVYDMWREYRRESVDSATARTAREAAQPSQFPRGSYYALQENYNNYRWAKLQELYLDELKQGFENETAPTEIELSDSLYRLTGTMEQQYREWRSILAELYELETSGL